MGKAGDWLVHIDSFLEGKKFAIPLLVDRYKWRAFLSKVGGCGCYLLSPVSCLSDAISCLLSF